MKYVGPCRDCNQKFAVSVEGWCLACLKQRLRDKFGPVPRGHIGTCRTQDQKQAYDRGEPNPWQENAIRAMEDA